MPTVGTSSSGVFACATKDKRTLKDLQTKCKGQPILVAGHNLARKGQEAVFELFNVRLATVKFEDETLLGYDPLELLLPTFIDEQGIAYFEIQTCQTCDQMFPLTKEECQQGQEPTDCPECANF